MNEQLPQDGRRPAACSLDAADGATRRRRWLELGERALLEKAATSRGVRLSYREDAGVERELRELAELERECCGFATWLVSADEDRIVLDVSAPGEGAAAVRAMFGEQAGVAG